jgi:hypothetical protein
MCETNKAPGNMEFMSTKSCCKLLLASGEDTDFDAWETVLLLNVLHKSYRNKRGDLLRV